MTANIPDILTVSVHVMALGVTVAGIIFASRILWGFFQKLLGGPTWRD